MILDTSSHVSSLSMIERPEWHRTYAKADDMHLNRTFHLQ